MFDEISMILYCLMRFVYKEKDADHAISLRKVINKEFLLNPSKHLKNMSLIQGSPQMMLLKTSRLLLKRREDFVKAVRRL